MPFAMAQSHRYWLVAVPGEGTGPRGVKKTMRKLTECIHVKGRRLAGALWSAGCRGVCGALTQARVRDGAVRLFDVCVVQIFPTLRSRRSKSARWTRLWYMACAPQWRACN